MTNVKVQFNKEIIKRLKETGMSIDLIGSLIFVLTAMYEGKYELLDEFDDNNKERRVLLLYRQMERMGLIEETSEDEVAHYGITADGAELIEYIQSEFVEDDAFVNQIVVPLVKAETIDEWIKEYIQIFPSGMHNGRARRTGRADCVERMEWFMNLYGYPKEVILAATKMYVKGFQGDFTMMRNSSYFIWKKDPEKGRISDLLTACENVEDDQKEDKKINFDLI